MSVIKYSAIALTLACCNMAVGQVSQQSPDQTRRAERVEERRDQFSQNREARQQNRDTRQADRATQGQQFGSNNQAGDMDQFIATCLLIGNQAEVAMAKDAVNRAQNENVKQFAQMMIDDHQKAVQKLQQHAKQGMGLEGAGTITASSGAQSSARGSAPGSALNREQSNQISSGQSGQGQQSDANRSTIESAQGDQIASNQTPSARSYTANRMNTDQDPMASALLDKVMKMDQQAAQECLSMKMSMMQEKQGAEFDKAYAGSQVGAHVEMLAKLKAAEQHASSELATEIRQMQSTVQQHLEHAKQLCEELESMQASNR
jgi:predicted outer membrane protein